MIVPVPNHLAAYMRDLGWSEEQMAEVSGVPLLRVQRALAEKQLTAVERARLVAAINRGRGNEQQEVTASEVFPFG